MTPSELCIICNPSAGRGRALSRLSRLPPELQHNTQLLPTKGPGHAEQLAREAAEAGCGIVAAAGGDGTVHEVANGILQSGRTDVALAVFPVGSANDYAYSLGLKAEWWRHPGVPKETRLVDVGSVRSPDGRHRYFVNGLGLGFNGAVTLESRRIRQLQGVPLYLAALLRALCCHYAAPVLDLDLDGKVWRSPTLALTVALGRREGNFILAPKAELDDGQFDFLHAGALARWELIRFVPRMITGRLPENHPHVRYGLCRSVSVSAPIPLIVHVDGEFFCLPADKVTQLSIELLPGRLRVWGPWAVAKSPTIAGGEHH